MTARHLICAVVVAIAFMLGASAAHAQGVDCGSALGQRVCANPNLTALEQERQGLISELTNVGAAHPALVQEEAWLSVQEGCADDACLAAGYLDHNSVLRQIVEELRAPEDANEPLAELPTITAPVVREDEPASAGGGREINPDPPFQVSDYFGALIAIVLAFLIAFWLLGKAARARRGD